MKTTKLALSTAAVLLAGTSQTLAGAWADPNARPTPVVESDVRIDASVERLKPIPDPDGIVPSMTDDVFDLSPPVPAAASPITEAPTCSNQIRTKFPYMSDFNRCFSAYEAWNGFYVGAHAGGSFASAEFGNDLSESDAGGIAFGLLAGFNHQFNSPWLVGLETDFEFSTVDAEDDEGPATSRSDSGFTGRLRGRAGYLIDPDALLYAAGGVSVSDREDSLVRQIGGLPSKGIPIDDYALGWNIGVGAEAKLDGRVRARFEYLYDRYEIDLDDNATTRVDTNSHTFRAALVYGFGG